VSSSPARVEERISERKKAKEKRRERRTLLNGGRRNLRELDKRDVAQLLDLLLVLDPLNNPLQVPSNLDLFPAGIDKVVHALVRRLTNVESVVDLVLERTHLDDSDEGLVDDGLGVELREEGVEVGTDELGLVVSGGVESGDGETANTLRTRKGQRSFQGKEREGTNEIWIPHQLEKLGNQRRKKLVVRRRVVREGEPEGSDDSRTSVARVGRETSLKLREVLGGIDNGELTEAVGGDVASTFFLSFAVLEERRPEGVGDGGESFGGGVDDDLRREESESRAGKRKGNRVTHLLERLKSEIPLLVIRLNKLENARKESSGVSDRNVSGSESRRTTNIFAVCRELLDNLGEDGLMRGEVDDATDLTESEEGEEELDGGGLGGLRAGRGEGERVESESYTQDLREEKGGKESAP
jgi:hypothetical protein